MKSKEILTNYPNLSKIIRLPKKISLLEIKKFFIKKKLIKLVEESKKKSSKVNDMIINMPYKPELRDLYNLYQYVFLNKRTTLLEFGSGYSSLIFSIALEDLKKKYQNKVTILRRNNPFELFIVENEKKYLNITKRRIKKFSKKLNINIKINYHFSDVEMSLYENKISTSYKKLPLCNPDFIYLDGPDQFNIKGEINNFSTRHKDMMPMANDILKIEYFLTPGTIIVTDGRTANAQFLRDYLKRNWLYKFDYINDQHIFYLNEIPLGKYNRLQLEFYKN
jgi:hypothetical protein